MKRRGYALVFILFFATLLFLIFAGVVQTQFAFRQHNEQLRDTLQEKAESLAGSLVE